jgi:hypothetical protein
MLRPLSYLHAMVRSQGVSPLLRLHAWPLATSFPHSHALRGAISMKSILMLDTWEKRIPVAAHPHRLESNLTLKS